MRQGIVWASICLIVGFTIVSCGGGGGISSGSGSNPTQSDTDTWTVAADGVTIQVSGNTTGYITINKDSSTIRTFGHSLNSNNDNTAPTVYMLSNVSAPMLQLPIVLNNSWQATGISVISNQLYVINTTTTITSVSESVTAADSTFTGCVKTVEAVSYPADYNNPEYQTNVERWFCPGVGLAKVNTSLNTGKTVSVLLTVWSLGTTGDYFPMVPGMTRQYHGTKN